MPRGSMSRITRNSTSTRRVRKHVVSCFVTCVSRYEARGPAANPAAVTARPVGKRGRPGDSTAASALAVVARTVRGPACRVEPQRRPQHRRDRPRAVVHPHLAARCPPGGRQFHRLQVVRRGEEAPDPLRPALAPLVDIARPGLHAEVRPAAGMRPRRVLIGDAAGAGGAQRFAVVGQQLGGRGAALVDLQRADHDAAENVPRLAAAHQLPVVPDVFAAGAQEAVALLPWCASPCTSACGPGCSRAKAASLSKACASRSGLSMIQRGRMAWYAGWARFSAMGWSLRGTLFGITRM